MCDIQIIRLRSQTGWVAEDELGSLPLPTGEDTEVWKEVLSDPGSKWGGQMSQETLWERAFASALSPETGTTR